MYKDFLGIFGGATTQPIYRNIILDMDFQSLFFLLPIRFPLNMYINTHQICKMEI